jgi:hypothetical protein
MALTTTFVAAVRRQGSITAQYSDSDILLSGDMEVQTRLLPLLRRMRAEYGVRRLQLPIANGRVVMPDRSQVAGVRLVQLVQGNALIALPQVQPEDDYGTSVGGAPYGWYFDAAGINIVPSNATGQVLVRYYQAAPSMILSSDTPSTSEITAVTVGASLTTVTFSGSTTVSSGDVISGRPSHHVVLPGLVSGTGSASYSNSVYPSIDTDRPIEIGAITSTLRIGDYVAPNGRTPFVPVPEELFGVLVHRTAGVMLRASGYLEESSAQLQLADEAEVLARDLLAPRSEGTPRALLGGISAAMGRRGWRW